MGQVDPGTATRQLAEIEARQAAVIRRVLVPLWYWWLVGAGMVGLGWAADTRQAAVVVPAALTFAILVAALSLWVIAGGPGGARARAELLGAGGAVAIVLLDWVVVGGGIGAAFGLQAAGIGHPGLLGCLVAAVLLVLAGPPVMNWIGRRMQAGLRR